MQSSTLSKFYLKLSFNSASLYEFICKHIDFLNNIFEFNKKQIFIETIYNGFLIFCENYQVFSNELNQLRQILFEERNLFCLNQTPIFLKKAIIEKFPAEGLILIIEVQNDIFSKFIQILSQFVKQIDPQIHIVSNKPIIKVYFTQIDFLFDYLNSI